MKRLLISKDRHETRAALLDDGQLSEFFVERPGRLSLVGNIYKGRVENVLAGMDAAFVDIGMERNGYLYVDEVVSADAGPGGNRKITDLLRSGREVLVQVTRDGMGSKGPRLTTQIGMPGRYLVFMPGASTCGVSRRLDDAERERLRTVGNALRPENTGLIIRTAAEGAAPEAIERDMRFLQRVWGGVERRAEDVTAPVLVYKESELPIRVVRDFLGPDFEDVIVDDEELHRRLRNYVHAVAPELADRVIFYDEASRLQNSDASQPGHDRRAREKDAGSANSSAICATEDVLSRRPACLDGRGFAVQQPPRALFERHGVEKDVRRALGRRVDLPSGGYLVIDPTEAMTVIDVNTGRFVGKRFLEDTTLKTNLEACREIVHQLRLRDIGGIIVIDFIDMTARANRTAVLAALESELARDRTKTYVVEISPLGLVEMTRQNVTKGLREVMTCACPMCHGEGRVLSDESAMIAVERRLEDMSKASNTPGLRVEVHPRMLLLLTAGRPSQLERLERTAGRFVILVSADETVALDHAAIVPD